jgi:hypothetical protein
MQSTKLPFMLPNFILYPAVIKYNFMAIDTVHGCISYIFNAHKIYVNQRELTQLLHFYSLLDLVIARTL